MLLLLPLSFTAGLINAPAAVLLLLLFPAPGEMTLLLLSAGSISGQVLELGYIPCWFATAADVVFATC